MRLTDQHGPVAHAELRLGPTMLMLVDEHPEYGIRAPELKAIAPEEIQRPFETQQRERVGS